MDAWCGGRVSGRLVWRTGEWTPDVGKGRVNLAAFAWSSSFDTIHLLDNNLFNSFPFNALPNIFSSIKRRRSNRIENK